MSDKIDTVQKALIWISAIIQMFVMAPILLRYVVCQYRLQQNHIVYSVRYSIITCIQCLLLAIKVISYPTAELVFEYSDVWDLNSKCFNILIAISTCITFSFLFCFVWRLWLLRFNIIFSWILIQNEWKSVIARSGNSLSSSFYIRHKRTLGNFKCTMGICVFVTSVFATVTITIVSLYHIQESKMQFGTWAYMVPYLFLLFIYFTTPKVADNFSVREEMKYIIYCLTVNYIIFYSIMIFLYYGPYLNKDERQVLFHIGYLCLISCQFATMMVSTFWVNRRCERIIAADRYQIHEIPSNPSSDVMLVGEKQCIQIQPDGYETVSKLSDEFESIDVALEAVLGDDRLIDSFSNHLMREFSVECLLSFIEFEQFRARAMNELTIELPIAEPTVFSSIVPSSDIVSGIGKETPSLKECAYRLYIKYLAVGSEFEINISWSLRQKLNVLLSDYDKWMGMDISSDDLCGIFDAAIGEMVGLLRSSIQRFQQELRRREQTNVNDG